LTELGVNLFTGPTGYKDWIARTTTQQFSAPNYSDMERTADLNDNLTGAAGKYSLSDFLNIFVFNNKYNIGTVIRALQEKGLFQSLAEPNLIASNGKEASFLAGGEYPYPIVQPGTGGNAVTIMFKEFGIRLNFTPTVLNGDMINLKVRPEVSALDFSSAITLSGFRVPALSTRRTETEVELANGQTFAIAGLMNNTVTNTMRTIPGIGDIPILGWLFKSKAMAKNQTELVVMITPTIVRKGSMGVSEGVPSAIEPYLGAPKKTLPQPAPWTGSPKYPANQPGGQPNKQDDQAPAQAQSQTTIGQTVPVAVPQTAAPKPQEPVAPAQSQAPAPKAAAPKAAAPLTAKAEPKPDPKDLSRFREDQKRAEEAQKRAEAAQQAAEKKAADEKAAADKKAAEEKAIADKKAAEEKAIADKKAAEEKAAADKKAAEEKARQDKLDAERAKREAEVAKKNAEAEKKRQADMKKHEKSVAEAAARLKEAQAAYQAEMEKKKGGSL
jgi:hypothetical protein